MKILLLILCTISFVFANEDFAQKVAELKKQAVRILKLKGKPVNPDKFNPTAGTGWDDIQMTEKLYKNLKKNFDIEERARSGGDLDRVASPDFDRLPFERWPMPVQYNMNQVYDDDLKDTIRQGLAELESKTCIRFEETEFSDGPHVEYVQVDVPNICGDSPMGRQPEFNRIRLVCKNYGTALHETLHTLGFGHTQMRADADQYVLVHWDNILSGYESNFQPWEFARTDQGEYDYGSIMHYSKSGFAVDQSIPTMEALIDPEVNTPRMGQRDGLSDLDAQEINRIYCSDQGPEQSSDVAVGSHGNKSSNATIHKKHSRKDMDEELCADMDYSCLQWFEDGLCNNTNYTVYKDCPVACGICQLKLDSKVCVDYNEHCIPWSQNGYCSKKSKSHDYMAQYCKATCGFCTSNKNKSPACVVVWNGKNMTGDHKKVCGRAGYVGQDTFKDGFVSWNQCSCPNNDCLVMSWKDIFAGHFNITQGKETGKIPNADKSDAHSSLIVSCSSSKACIDGYEFKDFRGKKKTLCGSLKDIGKEFNNVMSSWNGCTCKDGQHCLVVGYDETNFKGQIWYSTTNSTYLGPIASKRISSLTVSCF